MGTFSEERFYKVIDAVLKNENYDSISKRVGISKKTIYDYIKRLNTPGDAYYNPNTYQRIQMLKQIEEDRLLLKVSMNYLIRPNITLEEFSKSYEDSLSSSTIQRYLKNSRIIELVGQSVYDAIQEKLNQSIQSGHIKGGVNSFLNNQPKKNPLTGMFEGSTPNPDSSKVFLKMNDIFLIEKIKKQNPEITLEEIAGIINNLFPEREITRDYIFDCLNNKPQYFSLIAENKDDELKL